MKWARNKRTGEIGEVLRELDGGEVDLHLPGMAMGSGERLASHEYELLKGARWELQPRGVYGWTATGERP